jgi:hypothetical protein
MADAANDSVPTEGAVRGYIDRRLGVNHFGIDVNPDTIIPSTGEGGFMALSGQLPMKGIMRLNNFRIADLGTPTVDTDAARLDSINISNLKDTDANNLLEFNSVQSSQILALTGNLNKVTNVTVTGDMSLTLIAGLSNQIRADITDESIVNSDINPNAAIVQSKLNLLPATTRINADAITQAEKGIASFNSSQFNSDNGWISVKDNGISLEKIAKIGIRRLLGNPSSTSAGDISAIEYSTVVDEGGAIKKSQFSSGVGFIKRVNATLGAFTSDGHYSIINDTSSKTGSTLVSRDVNGDFSSRQITVDELRLTTISTGNYTVLRSNEITTTRGSTEIFGYGGGGSSSFVGIGVESGAAGSDRRTIYNNDTHLFRNQSGATTFATLNSSGFNIGSRALTATTLTTGAAGTNGTITGTWRLSTGSTLHATYAADLAEYYEGDAEYDVGTVLIFGGDKEVTISTLKEDSRVAGVVSNCAAFIMYDACPGFKNQIALQGRVPVKVVGKISKGTILVTSDIPGVAKSAGDSIKAGTMIGKALENYDSDKVGIIEVAVGRT